MSDEPSSLPDARALALISMAASLARTIPDLVAWGAENAATFKSLDPPTLAAARAVYARRMGELKGDRK